MMFVELDARGRFTPRTLPVHDRHHEMVFYLRNAYRHGLWLDEMLEDIEQVYETGGYLASMALIEATIGQCRQAGMPDTRIESEIFERFVDWPTDADDICIKGQTVGIAFISD